LRNRFFKLVIIASLKILQIVAVAKGISRYFNSVFTTRRYLLDFSYANTNSLCIYQLRNRFVRRVLDGNIRCNKLSVWKKLLTTHECPSYSRDSAGIVIASDTMYLYLMLNKYKPLSMYIYHKRTNLYHLMIIHLLSGADSRNDDQLNKRIIKSALKCSDALLFYPADLLSVPCESAP